MYSSMDSTLEIDHRSLHSVQMTISYLQIISIQLNRVNLKCPPLLEDELLVSIAKKYKKSTAQVALRFNAQRGVVVIPKSFSPQRIKENFQVCAKLCI